MTWTKTPPPNLRQVEGCCGSCRHYRPGYDIGTCSIHDHAGGPAFVDMNETCDDCTPHKRIEEPPDTDESRKVMQ